jgi:hypothetical protein
MEKTHFPVFRGFMGKLKKGNLPNIDVESIENLKRIMFKVRPAVYSQTA